MNEITPNPIGNEGTMIYYSIGFECNVIIKVYNIDGKEILELVNEMKDTGNHRIEYNSFMEWFILY